MGCRKETLRKIESSSFAVWVIGGGATGAGCALDAQLRGLRTVLKVVAGVRNGKQKLERIRCGMAIQWTRETEAGRTDLKIRYQQFSECFGRQGA